MPITIKTIYLGDLRTEATHVQSNTVILTDAPVDNNGKGEAFSPTDLVCTALGSCMLTIMGIIANRENIALEGTTLDITKIMSVTPRKINEIVINFTVPNADNLSAQQKQKLSNAAHTCPVALSLASDITQVVNFNW
jgi:putative redox protein